MQDGLYDLTSTTIYQSSPATQLFYLRETLRISQQGTFLEVVNDGLSGVHALAETIAPAGALLQRRYGRVEGARRGLDP